MLPSEGYFYLKCQKTGLVLCISDDNAGSKVIIGSKKEDDGELWAYDNGYLMSKKTQLVLDIDGGDLKSDKEILQYDRKKTMAHNQRWGMRDGFIYAVADPRLVLDAKDDEGSYITVATRLLEENGHQQWYLETYTGDY